MEEFLEKHGYPQDKWMKDRINNVVTRFQAIWRGHLYKKAYPLALEQKREEDANIYREFLEWCGSLPMETFRSFPVYCQVTHASDRVRAFGRKLWTMQVLYPVQHDKQKRATETKIHMELWDTSSGTDSDYDSD
jgi:hypothetical protein